jgi:hypothetical protein
VLEVMPDLCRRRDICHTFTTQVDALATQPGFAGAGRLSRWGNLSPFEYKWGTSRHVEH